MQNYWHCRLTIVDRTGKLLEMAEFADGVNLDWLIYFEDNCPDDSIWFITVAGEVPNAIEMELINGEN